MIRILPALLTAALAVFAVIGPVAARQADIYTGYFSSLAVGGYDPVAYFKQGKPVEGRPRSRPNTRAQPGALRRPKT